MATMIVTQMYGFLFVCLFLAANQIQGESQQVQSRPAWGPSSSGTDAASLSSGLGYLPGHNNSQRTGFRKKI